MKIVKNRFNQGSKSIGNIVIVPDVRFFTLYSIFNGPFYYRHEIMDKMADDRIELISDLDALLATVDVNKLKKWQAYYDNNDVHLWTYIYYTSFCGFPPEFELGDDIEKVAYYSNIIKIKDFNRILSEFYVECDIEKLYFDKYKKILLSYIDIYDEETITKEIEYMFNFLRIDKNRYKCYKLIIIPIPFDSHCVGYGAPQREKLYLFESKGAQRNGINIHEYLHLFINEAVESISGLEKYDIARVFEENRNKDWVISDYGELKSYIAENFVRAIDHKIRDNLYGRKEGEFDLFRKSGLTLVEYIYRKLGEYEGRTEKYKDIYFFVNDIIVNYHN